MSITVEQGLHVETLRIDGRKFVWDGDTLRSISSCGAVDVGFAIQDFLHTLNLFEVRMYEFADGRLVIHDSKWIFIYDLETNTWQRCAVRQ